MNTDVVVSLNSLLPSMELTEFSVYRSAEEGRNDNQIPNIWRRCK